MMTKTTPPHLRPSAAHRWMRCPFSAQPPEIEPTTSSYAEEGTLAHAVAAARLGVILPVPEHTEEMDQYVQTYVDYCERRIKSADSCFFEQKVVVDLGDEKSIDGTPDFASCEEFGTIEIVDLKYGKGVRVDARNNLQLQIYALGAYDFWCSFGHDLMPTSVKLTIVQPRLDHVDRWEIETPIDTWAEDLREQLRDAARRCDEPNPARVPGDWCRWCPHERHCTAPYDQLLTVVETSGVVKHSDASEEPANLEEVLLDYSANATPEMIGEALKLEKAISNMYKALRSRGESIIMAGGDIPGYKLVQTRKNRSWNKSEEEIANMLRNLHLPAGKVHTKKLRSPAQIEKEGKKFARFVQRHTERLDGGYSLVEDRDVRPGCEFGNMLTAVSEE